MNEFVAEIITKAYVRLEKTNLPFKFTGLTSSDDEYKLEVRRSKTDAILIHDSIQLSSSIDAESVLVISILIGSHFLVIVSDNDSLNKTAMSAVNVNVEGEVNIRPIRIDLNSSKSTIFTLIKDISDITPWEIQNSIH